MNQKGLSPILIIILIAILGVGGYFVYQNQIKPSGKEQIACTLDAKICSDGSSVGRIGPNCEFAACPASRTASSTQTSDEITQTVRTYALLEHNYKKPIITIEFIQNDYARGNIGEKPGSGATWFAAKISGNWTVVHMGNGLPECKGVSKYNLPQSFLMCY